MKILIIGGTGLISTAITRVLQERGQEVIHYNRGRADSQLAEMPATILGDRKDFAAFEAQMADAAPFDCVIDMIGFLPAEVESAVRVLSPPMLSTPRCPPRPSGCAKISSITTFLTTARPPRTRASATQSTGRLACAVSSPGWTPRGGSQGATNPPSINRFWMGGGMGWRLYRQVWQLSRNEGSGID